MKISTKITSILLILSMLFIACACSAPVETKAEIETTNTSAITEATETTSEEEKQEKPEEKSLNITKKDVEIFTLSAYYKGTNEVLDLSKQEGKVELFFIEGKEYIPYMTLKNFLTLYTDYINAPGFENTYEEDGDNITFIVTGNDKEYAIQIDKQNSLIKIKNSIYDLENENSKSSTTLELNKKVTKKSNNDFTLVFSFANESFTIFNMNDETYFPFALLEAAVNNQSTNHLFYNYTALYHYVTLFSKESALKDQQILYKGKQTTVFSQMKENIKEEVMPLYLREFNRDILLFTLENLYGLSVALEIVDMKAYLQTYGMYEDLVSENPDVRAAAMKKVFLRFEDDHSIFLGDADVWGESSDKVALPQSMSNDRSTLSASMSKARESVYNNLGISEKDVVYSKDGKTAVIVFNAFENVDNAYDENGKALPKEELIKTDTYFQLKDSLEKVQKHGGVENVIIDMSTNVGGDADILLEVLALLSKDNNGTVIFYTTKSQSATIIEGKVDSNNDGKYDENDVYGNKFNIYLLTTPNSFSCGNALPFYCEKYKMATIIGQTSGGGECAITETTLPNGQRFTYSSDLRVSVIDGDGNLFTAEPGGEVDIPIAYHNFYDIEYLNSVITSLK